MEPQKRACTRLDLASAAHELKNPAEALTNLVYILRHNPSLNEEALQNLQLMEKEVEHMRHVISQTLERYREPANPTLVSLADLIDTVLRFFDHKVAFKQIQVEKQYECEGLVKAQLEDLRQVFSNLIVNGLEALRLHGRLTIRISPSHNWRDDARPGVRVIIADNGTGVLPEDRGKIMTRQFFTTKGEKGTGLGLWVSARIVRQAGGSMRFRSSIEADRHGTIFSVFLPTTRIWEVKNAA